MQHRFARTELLIGKNNLSKLHSSTVAIVGIGGVGSYAVEALARTGIGHLILIDKDDICVTNINRQIHATEDTIGRPKVEVMKERILRINPDMKVSAMQMFFDKLTANELFSHKLDYIIDAIDTISSKIDLIVMSKEKGIPIISSMGAGNKLNPVGFKISDISKTSVCPIAKILRKELKKYGIYKGVKVVFSEEQPIKQKPPASIAFIPSIVGLTLAGTVVNDLINNE